MRLDAYVPCNCWAERLTTEPPFARDQLEFRDGLLELRDVSDPLTQETIASYRTLDVWLETCCPHPNMQYCDERVDDWLEARVFAGYVNRYDTGQFQVLRRLMPNGNGDEVSPVDCARGLAELDLLSDAIAGQPGCFLVDNRIGLEVYDYVGAADEQTRFEAWTRCSFDPTGIFITQGGTEVFRAMRARQRIIEQPDHTHLFEWTADDGTTFLGTALIDGMDRDWEVVTRPLTIDDVPCVDELRNLFQASLATGNPVYWT